MIQYPNSIWHQRGFFSYTFSIQYQLKLQSKVFFHTKHVPVLQTGAERVKNHQLSSQHCFDFLQWPLQGETGSLQLKGKRKNIWKHYQVSHTNYNCAFIPSCLWTAWLCANFSIFFFFFAPLSHPNNLILDVSGQQQNTKAYFGNPELQLLLHWPVSPIIWYININCWQSSKIQVPKHATNLGFPRFLINRNI